MGAPRLETPRLGMGRKTNKQGGPPHKTGARPVSLCYREAVAPRSDLSFWCYWAAALRLAPAVNPTRL